MDKLIPIGTETKFGKVEAVGFITGERYYWLINKAGTVSMIPHSVLAELFSLERQATVKEPEA